jgi:hypothetical protein
MIQLNLLWGGLLAATMGASPATMDENILSTSAPQYRLTMENL